VRRALPIVALLLVAAGLGAWLLAGGTSSPNATEPVPEERRPEEATPDLVPAPARVARPPPPEAGTEPEAPPPAPVAEGPKVRGVVLDDETGAPVAGAVVGIEPGSTPCPRLPVQFDARYLHAYGEPVLWHAYRHAHDAFPGIDAQGVRTGEDGTFAIPANFGGGERFDVFVRRAGYVVASVCSVAPESPTTVRLRRGLSISGTVVDAVGRLVLGAIVRAEAAPGTAIGPGHVEETTSDAEGKFALTGLLPGLVVVTADHPNYMPASLPPMEPGRSGVRIELVPALVANLRLHTDDGKRPEAPSLSWRTSGTPPREGLQLLEDRPAGWGGDNDLVADAADKTYSYRPVRLPCDRPDVTLNVKSVGYAPWTFGPDPLPRGGGEKTYEVNLEHDRTLGALKVLLADRDGKALSFAGEAAQASPWRRDGKPVPGGVIMRTGDALEMPALPAGAYGLLVRSPKHSPALVTADVVAEQTTEVTAVVGPPAKLRVRFSAPEVLLVRFHVLLGRDETYPFPETEAGKAATAQGEEAKTSLDAVLHAGADGLLLTGLGAGRHVVEVISPDLVATPTPVDLVEGETREVEIAVTKR
jgi:hypothetical protein